MFEEAGQSRCVYLGAHLTRRINYTILAHQKLIVIAVGCRGPVLQWSMGRGFATGSF